MAPLSARRRNSILAATVLAASLATVDAHGASPKPPTKPDLKAWQAYFTSLTSPRFKLGAGDLAEGHALSQRHCAVCHVRPEPEALPKAAWAELFTSLLKQFAATKVVAFPGAALPAPALQGRGPSTPADGMQGYHMSSDEYAKAAAYYIASAPVESLPIADRPTASSVPAPFRVKKVFRAPAKQIHYFSMAAYDAPSRSFAVGRVLGEYDPQNRRIAISRAADRNALLLIDAAGEVRKTVVLGGSPTGFARQPDGIYLTYLGPDPFPTAKATGSLVRLAPTTFEPQPVTTAEETVLAHLRRPVHTTFADFDADGRAELLVEEFGFSEGSLSLFTRAADGKLARRTLFDGPGTVGAAVADFDRDGTLDISSLASQSDERLFLFRNPRKEAGFVAEVVRRDQPGFGYQSLAAADFDGDGAPDLVTANGDNFDLSTQPLKNYHGVRVLRNSGKGSFSEAYFYPMHGATQILTGDYDLDGDIDLVVTAFYPDLSVRAPETAVYLENRGGMRFVPHAIADAGMGRWLVGASGDIDGDGDLDVLLTAGALGGKAEAAAFPANPGYLLLENTTR